jgi:hypothetical protein
MSFETVRDVSLRLWRAHCFKRFGAAQRPKHSNVWAILLYCTSEQEYKNVGMGRGGVILDSCVHPFECCLFWNQRSLSPQSNNVWTKKARPSNNSCQSVFV